MRKAIHICIILYLVLPTVVALSQSATSNFRIGRVKYSGGGDWYNDPSAEVNLLRFFQTYTSLPVQPVFEYVDLKSENIFRYPILFLTGHGGVRFTETEVRNLRAYLQNGGFLYIDDDYGLDKDIRREMKKVFPDRDFVEIPYSHPLYSIAFEFPNGPPKIHEHDGKPPQGFGIFYNGRLCVFYTYESNPSDGWADPDVHGDPPEKRQKALQFGVNILLWALTH